MCSCPCLYALPGGAFSFTACLRGPLRVRALVRVRCPRTGSPLRCRIPRQVPRSMRRLMFIETSRRRSPSTGHLAICERIAATSASVRSLTRVVGAMPAPSRISIARERPMPKMCVSPMLTCLFIGMLMPAMRAIYRLLNSCSALALLVARIGTADDEYDAAAPHDLAVLAYLLDGWTYF